MSGDHNMYQKPRSYDDDTQYKSMKTDTLTRMAREAGFVGFDGSNKMLRKFAALVAAAEREACASVCCDMIDAEYKTGKVDHNEMAWTQACAAAIRARGEKA